MSAIVFISETWIKVSIIIVMVAQKGEANKNPSILRD